MFRISNRMMYNNTLINAFRNNQGLLAAQEQISSGKRINRPSDDPVGIMEVLQYRTDIGRYNQYITVMGNAESFLNTADSTLGSVHDELKSVKELALQQAGGMSSAETRNTAAISIDNKIEQMIQYGNTRVGNRYIFAGQKTESPALNAQGGYAGSGKNMTAEIGQNYTIPISVRASEFLTADMNPAVSSANNGTLLASLNGGTGVPAGTFSVTDRAGNAVIVNTAAMTDVQDVIAAINGGGTNITASVSTDGTSITLTDATVNPTQALAVQDNATSQALGIAGTRHTSVFTGTDLDPALSGSTLVSDLYAGNGLTLSDISIVNGSASATVSFAGATTVTDILNAINTAGAAINVTAAIDTNTNRRLTITSGNPNTVAWARDPGAGTTAELLGIGGGRNVIPVLQKLSAALKANDTAGILGAVELLDSNMERTSSVRGDVGARVNQIVSNRKTVDLAVYDSTRQKSNVEDTDFIEAASELAMLQSAYQATLKSSAAIVQPTLMDFIQ